MRTMLNSNVVFVVLGCLITTLLAAGVAAAGDEEEAAARYAKARELLAEEKYRKAAQMYRTIFEEDAESAYAADALYWQAFAALFTRATLQPDEYFIRAGENSERICFVNSGLLRLFYRRHDGKEFNKSFSRENEFAGAYSAWLTQTPARFSIQALEQCHLLVAEFADLVVPGGQAHRCK